MRFSALTVSRFPSVEQRRRPGRRYGLLGTALVFAAASAAAQTPPKLATTTLETVVVTAQKRSENAQKTPIALTVLMSKALHANAVDQVNDLQKVSPSLTVSDNGVTRYVNIRGVGLGVSAPGVANGVAYFVDGLFLLDAPLYQDDPYFDLARVEVLRGPQGTLVGEGAIGGAIYVVSQTARPGVFGGSLEQEIGNYGEYRTEGMINVPLGDTWAVRFAFETEKRDSFFKKVDPPTAAAGSDPNHPGDLSRFAGRTTVAGKIGDDVDVTIRSEFQHRNSGGTAGKPIPGDPTDAPYLSSAPSTPFAVGFNAPTYDNSVETENSLEVNWRVTPDIRLRSLSGITTGDRHFAEDTDGSHLEGGNRQTNVREDNYSQEFNLVSTHTSKFQWVLGVFELYQSLGGVNYINAAAPPGSFFPPSATIARGRFSTNSFGLFGQGTYDITPGLQLVAGVRYSIDDTQDLKGGSTDQNGHTHLSVGAETNHAITGKVSLNYKITLGEFLFVTVARGYKAGGFNSATSKFFPEYVWDYETGLKSTLFGGHVRLQNGFFYYKYTSLQVPEYDTMLAFSDVANGGSAQVYGLESQFEARFGALSLDANASYNHSDLNSVTLINPRLLPFGGIIPLCGFGPGPCGYDFGSVTQNLTGRPLPFAPRWTAHAGAEYTFDIGTSTLTPRVSMSYLSDQQASLFPDQADRIKGHVLFDGMLTFHYNDHWRAEAYATNLFGKTYIAGKFDDLQYYGAPRQYGARLAYQF